MRQSVRTRTGTPTGEDFRSKEGTPIVIQTDTGRLYVLLDSGSVLEIVGATAAVVGSSLTINGGASKFQPASNDAAIEVYYNASSGKYTIGASNSATPDLVLKNNGGTERARLTNAGEFLVGVTSANANGGCVQLKSGITFPASQVDASDANTLDDYEENTWTPTDASGAGISFTTAVGTYTKIGRLVVAQASVIYPVTASGANAAISLPFTLGATSNASCILYSTDIASNVGIAAAGTALVQVVLAAGGAAKTNAQMSTDTVVFTLCYEV